MSYNKIYIGPVIVLSNVEKIVPEKHKMCVNKDCDFEGSLFRSIKDEEKCISCGKKFVEKDIGITYDTMDVIYDWQLRHDAEHSLTYITYEQGFQTLDARVQTPNKRKTCSCHFLYPRLKLKGASDGLYVMNECFSIETATLTPECDMEIFKKKFAKQIESLKSELGEENVKVQFRIIAITN